MIKVITCHHHRHKLAELFYLGIERLKESYEIEVYAAITKGDMKSIEIADRHGAKWVEHENKPLGKKWNAAYKLACEWGNEEDSIIIMGEDNLRSSLRHEDQLLREQIVHFERSVSGVKNAGKFVCGFTFPENNHVFGFKRCGVIDTKSKTVKEWAYKDDIQLIGAGRTFSQPQPFKVGKSIRPLRIGAYQVDNKSIVPIHPNAENGRCFTAVQKIYALWDDNLNSGLDRSSEQNLAWLGYEPFQFDDGRLHVLDFKSDANIHKFSEFGGCQEYTGDWKWFLSDKEKEYLHKHFGL